MNLSLSLLLPLVLSVSSVSAVALAQDHKEASSEIPARREFPLNDKVNPCEDFHKYVCSDVEASFKLRDDRSHHDFAFNDSSERILEFKKNFFLNLDKEKNLKPRTAQLKDYYLACMDIEAHKKDEKKYVADYVKKVEAVQNISQLMDLNNENMLAGRSVLLDYFRLNNLDDPFQYDVGFIGGMKLLPEQSYYEKADVLQAYEDMIVENFKAIGVSQDEKALHERAQKMIALEKEFMKTYPYPAEMRQLFSEKREISRADWLKNYPKFQLEKFMKRIPKNIKIRFLTKDNFNFLHDALTESNLPVLKDFFLFRMTHSIMDDAYPDYYQKRFEFNRKFLGGPDKRPERQERCTNRVMDSFTKELDAELITRMFKGFPEDKIIALGEKIRQSIISGITRNTWLSKESKTAALEKIKIVRLQLVQPHTDAEWDFNPILKYSPTEPIGNNLKLDQALNEKQIKEFSKRVNPSIWDMGPMTVNAYYSPSNNKFVMPVGILQYPFFDTKGSDLENLAAVGAVMGHEIGHGIDDQGAKFDARGVLRQWMTDTDIKEFRRRGQKLIDQFNKAGHNGQLTLGENVADLVGLSFAYHAAFPHGQPTTEEKKKFFISYARLWCGVTRPKFEEMLLKTDPHAMGWARINEQVKQQPAFAEAFQCKAGDPMTLPDAERVVIW